MPIAIRPICIESGGGGGGLTARFDVIPPGVVTHTPPTGVGTFTVRLGVAITTADVFLNTDMRVISP